MSAERISENQASLTEMAVSKLANTFPDKSPRNLDAEIVNLKKLMDGESPELRKPENIFEITRIIQNNRFGIFERELLRTFGMDRLLWFSYQTPGHHTALFAGFETGQTSSKLSGALATIELVADGHNKDKKVVRLAGIASSSLHTSALSAEYAQGKGHHLLLRRFQFSVGHHIQLNEKIELQTDLDNRFDSPGIVTIAMDKRISLLNVLSKERKLMAQVAPVYLDYDSQGGYKKLVFNKTSRDIKCTTDAKLFRKAKNIIAEYKYFPFSDKEYRIISLPIELR